jgi:aminopeptidase N
VHQYLTTHGHAGATSDDFRQAVLTATGENLDWFWNEWVYGAGHPQFVVTSTYDAPSARLTLTVKQTQVDSFKVDSTGRLFMVPQAFRMPVAVRVGFGNGERVQRFELTAREQTLVVDSIASPPTMVVFDDGNHILKSLSFEQPVSWLVNQLQHDSNLWNRQWALAQLARFPTDPTAQAAVSATVTGADYFLTRAEAIDALSAFPPTVAKAPLVAAMKDTSAAVRAAAIDALGHVGGPDIATLAKSTFLRDSSYSVRAAALTALALLDPTQTHALLPAALRTPSYQDAIQITALVTAAQINDTTVLAEVDALAGKQELALNVLATFAARGNSRALDRFAAHLDDSRAAVRRWTVRQFRQTLARSNKAMALERLEGAAGGLKYADTKAAVAELIATLRKP